MKRVRLKDYVELCGGLTEASRRMRISPQRLCNWLARAPEEYEVITDESGRAIKIFREVDV